MTHISIETGRALPNPVPARFKARWTHPAGLAGIPTYSLPWGRLVKFGVGAALLSIGALTTYQQVVVRVSREAVINARVVSIRAPMDGIVKAAASAPGTAVRSGMAIGQIEDPNPDDARSFQLQLDLKATERERDALSRRLDDLQRARAEANMQAESFQLGRVRQDELRVDEARASVAAATAREQDATAVVTRGAALHENGYMADAAYERAYHAKEAAQQETIAARKRLDALTVELEAARNGTYLGDNYNDVPSSVQRARELTVRIDETKASLDELIQKDETITAQLTAERTRLAARSSAALTAPIDGNLWTVQAAAGEYVRKGQELFTVLDCSTVAVTASVSERDYNELRLGEPVRFRVAGTGREYSGRITKLGLTSTGRSFAISPEERRQQVAVQLFDLPESGSDSCAVGRTGEIVFEGSGHGQVARVVETVRHFLGLA
jgi:multidrug resistance efflux pump